MVYLPSAVPPDGRFAFDMPALGRVAENAAGLFDPFDDLRTRSIFSYDRVSFSVAFAGRIVATGNRAAIASATTTPILSNRTMSVTPDIGLNSNPGTRPLCARPSPLFFRAARANIRRQCVCWRIRHNGIVLLTTFFASKGYTPLGIILPHSSPAAAFGLTTGFS